MTFAARYDLNRYVASYDFFNWLVQARADGAGEVIFDIKYPKITKWPREVVLQRFASFLYPGAALAGMKATIASSRDRDRGRDLWRPQMEVLIRRCREGLRIAQLESILPARKVRYTVTLRNDKRRPDRNSNRKAWTDFAAEIGALVIEDWDDRPIHLHERVALYAGATMNFFVPNGPMHLCSLTPYPMMCFFSAEQCGGFTNAGMSWGEQYPWCGPDQILCWEPDEPDIIRRRFRQWRIERAVEA